MSKMLDEATLRLLTRTEIQKLARANKIKANLKTSVIIDLLIKRSRNQEINSAVIGSTRAVDASVKVEDEGLAELPQPAPVGSRRGVDFTGSISAAIQSINVEDGAHSESDSGNMYSPESDDHVNMYLPIPQDMRYSMRAASFENGDPASAFLHPADFTSPVRPNAVAGPSSIRNPPYPVRNSVTPEPAYRATTVEDFGLPLLLKTPPEPASHPETLGADVAPMYPEGFGQPAFRMPSPFEAYMETAANPNDPVTYAEAFPVRSVSPLLRPSTRRRISRSHTRTSSATLHTHFSVKPQKQGNLRTDAVPSVTVQQMRRDRAGSGRHALPPSDSHLAETSRALSARRHLLFDPSTEGLPPHISDIISESPPRHPRKFASSSLPPSSPPPNYTSPYRPHNHSDAALNVQGPIKPDERKPNDLPSLDMENSANWPEYWRRQNANLPMPKLRDRSGETYEESSTRSLQRQLPSVVMVEEEEAQTRSSDKENQTPSPQGSFIRKLPFAGSGDSAYSNYNNFYRDPPSDDSVNPEPMCEDTYETIVDSLGSLSRVYRRNIETCKALVNDVHTAEKDAIISRRLWTQEKFHLWRMGMFLGLWNNPALKYHPEAIWKAPIDLEIVGSVYAEADSDPRVELLRATQESHDRTEPMHIDGKTKDAPPADSEEVTTGMRGSKRKGSSQSLSQRLMAEKALSELTRSPNQPISSLPPVASAKSRGKKRARMDDVGESDHERSQYVRKIRKIAPCTAAPRALVDDAYDEEFAFSQDDLEGLQQDRSTQCLTASEEEDFIDEHSVESILAGAVEEDDLETPMIPTAAQDEIAQNIDSDYNPFLASDEEQHGEPELVEIEDEAGERHRRYSAVAKGKGRALA